MLMLRPGSPVPARPAPIVKRRHPTAPPCSSRNTHCQPSLTKAVACSRLAARRATAGTFQKKIHNAELKNKKAGAPDTANPKSNRGEVGGGGKATGGAD